MNDIEREPVAENDSTARFNGMRSTPGRIDSEIDIAELKSRIRSAVARREAEGRTSFGKASAELFDFLSAQEASASSFPVGDFRVGGEPSRRPKELLRLSLQPEFVRHSDDRYHVNDLLKYHDHQFVWNAYLALLKREPDEEGLRDYLQELRAGRFNKIDVLASLRRSPEGRLKKVSIDGLLLPALVRQMYRVPVLGYLVELMVGLARLPSLIRNQRKVEGYFVGQQERIANHINLTNQLLAEYIADGHQILADRWHDLNNNLNELHSRLGEVFSRSMSEVAKLANDQRRLARLQQQQVAALSREQHAARMRGAGLADQQSAVSENGTRFKLDELYASFQSRFRGGPERIKEDLKVYLPVLKASGVTSDILDIGCGRGEWLELLREEGLKARGLESNPFMVTDGRNRGLEIIQADAKVYLDGLPENNLAAVTAFHFVEHLGLDSLIDLLNEIRRVLKPGGLLILETPNPKNLVVGACNFYSDPTHQRPLFPESLQFILNHLGFADTRIEYLHPVEGSPFDNGDDGARALHAWFFSPLDYAVSAYKPTA